MYPAARLAAWQQVQLKLVRVLTDAEFRHGLLEPDVRTRRPRVYGHRVYVRVASLEQALRERGCTVAAGELDEYGRRLGGHRVQRGKWLARLTRVKRLERPAEYFLPEIAFQRVRQRRL
jgi:hypothetical protein